MRPCAAERPEAVPNSVNDFVGVDIRPVRGAEPLHRADPALSVQDPANPFIPLFASRTEARTHTG